MAGQTRLESERAECPIKPPISAQGSPASAEVSRNAFSESKMAQPEHELSQARLDSLREWSSRVGAQL